MTNVTPNVPEITNICSVLSSAPNMGPLLGYLGGNGWHHQIHQRMPTPGQRKLENLRNIVQDRQRRGYSAKEKLVNFIRALRDLLY
jgi:hypothetical protein